MKTQVRHYRLPIDSIEKLNTLAAACGLSHPETIRALIDNATIMVDGKPLTAEDINKRQLATTVAKETA